MLGRSGKHSRSGARCWAKPSSGPAFGTCGEISLLSSSRHPKALILKLLLHLAIGACLEDVLPLESGLDSLHANEHQQYFIHRCAQHSIHGQIDPCFSLGNFCSFHNFPHVSEQFSLGAVRSVRPTVPLQLPCS